MQTESKHTPLFGYHEQQNAKIGDFGGYEMPLWYPTGPKKEHLAVIQKAGIFDTSHMAAITLIGKDAFQLLQHCFSKDLNACIGLSKTPIQEGKCVYGVFLNEKGGVIDDSLVYQVGTDQFMVIVNAGMGAAVADHLKQNQGAFETTIEDLTDQLGKIDVQGPAAGKIIEKIIQNPESVLDKFPYFNFKGYFNADASAICDVKLANGVPILLSRTGYTGEFGFEIFVKKEHTVYLWDQIISAGQEYEALTCGLAARDSLRAGAVLPLSHQDIGDWPFLGHPWLFALPYDESLETFTKEFIGSQALLNLAVSEYTSAFAGYDPRKVIPGEDTEVVDESGHTIGTVLTCATDMAIDRHEDTIYSIVSEDCPHSMKFRGLSCGFIKTGIQLTVGSIVYLKGNNRKLKVEIRNDIRPARTARKAIKKML
ncbi:aminomethyl transferase family protein [bacterium]|nr:aminomethyl transferase family protein [bacterium]